MKSRTQLWIVVTALLTCSFVDLVAADTRIGPGKDFKFPTYYSASNGVQRLKHLVIGNEAQFVTNSIIALKNPRFESYSIDGRIEWTATSPECTVNIETKEVNGKTNMTFRTADERLFISGVGFLWQQTNSMLILSNQSFTWIDSRMLTNNASTRQ